MNHIWVTEVLNRPQKHPNMVLNDKFTSVGFMRSRLSLVVSMLSAELLVSISAGAHRLTVRPLDSGYIQIAELIAQKHRQSRRTTIRNIL